MSDFDEFLLDDIDEIFPADTVVQDTIDLVRIPPDDVPMFPWFTGLYQEHQQMDLKLRRKDKSFGAKQQRKERKAKKRAEIRAAKIKAGVAPPQLRFATRDSQRITIESFEQYQKRTAKLSHLFLFEQPYRTTNNVVYITPPASCNMLVDQD